MPFGRRTRVVPGNHVLHGGAHWRNLENTMNQCVLRRRGLSLPSLQQPVTLSVIYARRSVVETVVRQFVHETTTSYCSADSVRPHRCCHLPNNLKLPPDVSYTSQWVNNRPHLCAAWSCAGVDGRGEHGVDEEQRGQGGDCAAA